MDATEPAQPTAWDTLAPLIDLVTPMAMRTVATLGVADALVNGPLPVADIAHRTSADVGALERTLQHLAAHAVFVERPLGVFGLNAAAELLRSDHPAGMRAQLDLEAFGGRMDLVFTSLLHTVRTGEPAWPLVFGAPFWESLAADPVMGEGFDAVMSSDPAYVDDRVGARDWSGADLVVDVGGGTGRLLVAILESSPRPLGLLVDLPETASRARRYFQEHSVGDRCQTVGQSFFEPLPAGGDVYLLANVLHDWNDDDAVAILRRCAVAAGAHGRVIVIEGPGSPDQGGSGFTEMNLRMLLLVGGRQRGEAENTRLAHQAGLDMVSTGFTPLGHSVTEYQHA